MLGARRWQTVESVGQGPRATVGRPVGADLTLDLSSLAGVTLSAAAPFFGPRWLADRRDRGMLEKTIRSLPSNPPWTIGSVLGETRTAARSEAPSLQIFGSAPDQGPALRVIIFLVFSVTGTPKPSDPVAAS